MGGMGSGRHFRWDTQTYLDENIAIDVRAWKREGLLIPGAYLTIRWSRNDEETDRINVQVEPERVVLHYRIRSRGEEWQDVAEPVQLAWTPCNFGGIRVWFICPSCHGRAAKLYSTSHYFLCRICCDQPYACQGESDVDRALRRARKMRKKLGASMNLTEPVWDKPKGMHWKTFERLKRQADAANGLVNAQFMARFGGRLGNPTR